MIISGETSRGRCGRHLSLAVFFAIIVALGTAEQSLAQDPLSRDLDKYVLLATDEMRGSFSPKSPAAMPASMSNFANIESENQEERYDGSIQQCRNHVPAIQPS